MITLKQAIRSLHPSAQFLVFDNKRIEWLSSDIPQPSDDEIAAEVAKLEAEHAATQYQRNRAAEYPRIEALVVALWESVVEERLAPAIELQAKRQAIKDKYPKE